MNAPQPHTDAARAGLLASLRKEILALEGFRPAAAGAVDVGLGRINQSFPNGAFPLGAIHEFLVPDRESAAASAAFIAGIAASLLRDRGTALWISVSRTLYPPAIRAFGIEPHRLIFIDLKRERDVVWVLEEALRCEGIAAVVGEVSSLGFTASRRLQLAVEESRTTGFVLVNRPQAQATTASIARWQVRPAASEPPDGLPGVGFPRWHVELLKARNGRPGAWTLEWRGGRFRSVNRETVLAPQRQRKTG